jgi:hypothetical protein
MSTNAVKSEKSGLGTASSPPADGGQQQQTIVRIRGKNLRFPAARVGSDTVFVSGTLVRVARIKDELFLPGDRVCRPDEFIATLKSTGLRADLFEFSQKPCDAEVKFPYHCEWDNVAVIDAEDFDSWWNALPQETRKSVRRARNRGVDVRIVALTDEFIKGVHEIYNESPLRQGKPFYHYGKSFDIVKDEIATFQESSDFIGAYHGAELLGFIKIVHMGRLSSIMHLVSKNGGTLRT